MHPSTWEMAQHVKALHSKSEELSGILAPVWKGHVWWSMFEYSFGEIDVPMLFSQPRQMWAPGSREDTLALKTRWNVKHLWLTCSLHMYIHTWPTQAFPSRVYEKENMSYRSKKKKENCHECSSSWGCLCEKTNSTSSWTRKNEAKFCCKILEETEFTAGWDYGLKRGLLFRLRESCKIYIDPGALLEVLLARKMNGHGDCNLKTCLSFKDMHDLWCINITEHFIYS